VGNTRGLSAIAVQLAGLLLTFALLPHHAEISMFARFLASWRCAHAG
jgi:hypothetical protein